MKRWVITASLAALLAAAWPAWAQPGPGQGGGRRGMDRPMPQRPMGPPPDRGWQRPDGQGPMGPPPDRGWQRPDGQGMQRRGMMTPEEREQLRRDIGDHGRDIYRDPRRGGPGKQ
jgi:hypothetical protein